jgi:protein RecA
MAIAIRKLPIVPLQVPASPSLVALAEETKGAIDSLVGAIEQKKGGMRRRERAPIIKHSVIEVYGELANVVEQMKKVYSPAIITRANGERVNFGRIPSGILSADLCLAGGLMASRGSMIYGNKSAGKSTIAARFVAAAQRAYPDKFAIWMDIEGTFDPPWAAMQGVDLDRLHIVEPETGESAVDIADALLRTMEVCIIVTDSIAFLTPMKEIISSAEDSFPGIHARLIGNYLRRVNATLLVERHRQHYPVVLHLNQFRMSIGVMFGDPRVLPGGKALEFATTQQIEISNKEHTNAEKTKGEKGAAPPSGDEKADKGTTVVYNEHSIKITKDKSGGRFKEGRFVLVRDESYGLPVGYVNQVRSIISFGLSSGVLDGHPTSFSVVDDPFDGKFRSAADFSKFLVDDGTRERGIVSRIVDTYRKKWGVT